MKKYKFDYIEEMVSKLADEFCVGADGLSESYGAHIWTCGTDSSMSMHKLIKEGNTIYTDRKNPFLHEV